MGVFTSCEDEEATLDGADAVYIEIEPTNIDLCAGDVVRLSARVSNRAGDNIDTPISWEIDDESVAKIVAVYDTIGYVDNPNYVPAPEAPEEGTSPDEGDNGDENVPTARAEGEEGEGDGEGEGEEKPEEPQKLPVLKQSWGVKGMQGAQGKTTNIRAKLENGMYGMTTVSVVYRSLGDAITVLTPTKSSYSRIPNDTVWFGVSPFSLVEDCTIDFNINVTATYNKEGEDEPKFRHPHQERADNIIIDKKQQRVGVVYTAPRICGIGECTITLNSGEEEEISEPAKIVITPAISPGFEVNGVRPLASEASPSNIKTCLMNQSMDINTTYTVAACIGVPNNGQIDIENAIAGEKAEANLFRWTTEGSAVVVEQTGIDRDYDGGYVSYMTVRSGARGGISTIKYVTPDTVMVCNITVSDYNVVYPVEQIVTASISLDEEGTEIYTPISELTATMGENASIAVYVLPEESYEYHLPEVTVEDESVLTLANNPGEEGYTIRFNLKKPGQTRLIIRSLDKEVFFPITVLDKVSNLAWDSSTLPQSVMAETSAEITAIVTMASGLANTQPVEFSVDNEDVATVALKPGTLNVAQFTAHSAGQVKVTASVGGYSISTNITVIEAADIEVAGDTGNAIGEGYLFLVATDGQEIEMLDAPITADIAGTYQGSGLTVNIGGSDYGNCTYDFTVADNGDGSYTINGTITLESGIKINLNNAIAEQ